jgi:hypothetical protein
MAVSAEAETPVRCDLWAGTKRTERGGSLIFRDKGQLWLSPGITAFLFDSRY